MKQTPIISRWVRLPLPISLLLTIPVIATAQTGVTVGTGYGVESYEFGAPEASGISSLTLVTAPFAVRAPIVGRAALTIAGAYAEGTLARPDGTKTSIAGLIDTQVQLDVDLAPGFTITAIGAIPTGHARQSIAEAEAAGAFAADLLPLRVTNWGSGGGFGLASSVAHAFGDNAVGVSVGYSVGMGHEKLEEDERVYRPGSELRVRAAFDRTIGRSAKASLQLTTYRYAEDQFGDQNLYRSGNRYSAIGSYAFAAGAASSAVVYAGGIHRTEGAFLLTEQAAAAQDLLLAGGGMRIPIGAMRVVPSVDTRVFRSADGVGQGYLAGVGGSIELPLENITITPTGKYRFGKVLVREDAESGVAGTELGVLIRFGGGR